MLLDEFNAMKNLPMFEIEINGEWDTYYIKATKEGLEAGGVCNVGFMPYGISVEWDECFSLDEHFQELHELCYEKSLEE